MSTLSYNTSPYFDDFNSKKGFHKILFKPGNAVQVRELNQIQSIFNNQMQKFASHLFKDGSRVTNGRTSITRCKYVILNTLSASAFLAEGNIIQSTSSFYEASILFTSTTSDGLTKIWFSKNKNGIEGAVNNFTDNEEIKIYDALTSNSTLFTTKDSNSTGEGMIFSVDEGIFYHSGNFIENEKQYIVLDDYGNLNISFKIGFNIEEIVVNASDDSSLLDNTLGYSNLGAPGADRQKLKLVLVAKPLDDFSDVNFIMLGKIESNIVTALPQDSEYSEIMDMLAKRTYETNGNYSVKKFKIDITEDVLNLMGENYVNGDFNYFRARLYDGTGYIKGYRVDLLNSPFVRIKKARDTLSSYMFSNRIEDRSKIYLKPYTGFKTLPVNDSSDYIFDYTTFDLYDNVISAGVPTGNKIGTCYLSNCEYVSGTINSNAVYSYYIHNIKLNTGKTIHDIKSVYNLTIKFAANKDTTVTEIINPSTTNLLFDIGVSNIKSLRSIDDLNISKISLTYRKKLTGILDSNSAITFNSSANESFLPFNSNTICYLVNGVTYTNIDVTNYISITLNKITIDLPNTHSGETIVVLHDTYKSNIQERKKTKTNYTYSKVLTENDIVNFKSTTGLVLSHCDIINLKSIKLHDGAISTPYTSITYDVKLNKNDTEYSYELSSVTLTNSKIVVTAGQTLEINYDYYKHSDGPGFFTIDSYDNNSIASNSSPYIGTIVTANGKLYNLSSCLDFRRFSGESSHYNYTIKSVSDIITDITVYTARKDIISIDRTGNIIVNTGIHSINPQPPVVSDDEVLPLYELTIPAYTFSANDITVKELETKRFTMRDIGKLEKRISNVEYYTILNLLEKSAADLQTKDNSGFDRFKNGFIVDNFKDFAAGDIDNIEFRSSVSQIELELKPENISDAIKLELDLENSVGIKNNNGVITLDYTTELADKQQYATNDLSLSVFNIYRKRGELILTPNKDIWSSKSSKKNNIGIDVSQGKSGLVVSNNWGDWSSTSRTLAPVTTILNQTVIPPVPPSQEAIAAAQTAQTVQTATPPLVLQGTPEQTVTTYQTAFTTVTDSTRTGERITLNNKTQNYALSEAISSINITNYIRPITVRCSAKGLWPNTRIYVFADNAGTSNNISLLCKQIGQNLIPNSLTTNNYGQIEFDLTFKDNLFYAGDLKIRISDNPYNDVTREDCYAEAIFYSQGIQIGTTQDTLNIKSSYLTASAISDFKSETNTSYSASTSTTITGETPTVIIQPTYNTNCPDGYQWDAVELRCVKIPAPTNCPEGYHWDSTKSQCVISDTNPFCGDGYHWDSVERRCVKDIVIHNCGDGFQWNDATGKCEEIAHNCGAGTHWDPITKTCVNDPPIIQPPNINQCPEGYTGFFGQCFENVPNYNPSPIINPSPITNPSPVSSGLTILRHHNSYGHGYTLPEPTQDSKNAVEYYYTNMHTNVFQGLNYWLSQVYKVYNDEIIFTSSLGTLEDVNKWKDEIRNSAENLLSSSGTRAGLYQFWLNNDKSDYEVFKLILAERGYYVSDR